MPRFMVIVKATEATEAGVLPTEQEFREMGEFNEELADAGALLAGDGLQPTSTGVRIRYDADNRPTVIDGPFAETKELVAGFWILKARSRDEVVEWMKRAPFRDGEIEIRRIFEDDDFGDVATPELREQDDRVRRRAAANRD